MVKRIERIAVCSVQCAVVRDLLAPCTGRVGTYSIVLVSWYFYYHGILDLILSWFSPTSPISWGGMVERAARSQPKSILIIHPNCF